MLKRIGYKDIIKFTAHYWAKRARTGLGLVALMVAATVIDVFVPIYTGKIVDVLVTYSPDDPGGLSKALEYLAIFICLGMTFNILRWGATYLWNRFAVYNLYEIVTDAMRKVQRFSSDWHANTFAGGTVRKITRGMWSFDVYGDTLFFGLMPSVIIMLGMTIMLIIQLPLVGLFVAGMIVVYAFISIWLSVSVLAPHYQQSSKADTKVGATLADIITGNPTVKTFAAETREDRFFDRIATLWRLRSQRAWVIHNHTDLVRGVLRMTMLGGMVGLTIWMWQDTQATPGDVALSLTSFFIVGGYLRDIGQHIANLQRSISEMEDVVVFWLYDDDLRDASDASELDVGKGAIRFDAVTFQYEGTDEPLFKDLSVDINSGEKIALVGYSGSGKSTFVKLVQRLYEIQGGEIRIDGQNIAHVTQESLRRNIGLVPQEPILFHRSLAANIAYGRPDARMDEIVEAAKKAYADDFIRAFPQGYDTLVGERGVKLSGGERQRVAIARAILADTPILILDEATSSLDSVSEHYIQKALEELMKGRTTITVAHRLSTIKEADRILVFDKGRIIEQGTHEALVNTEGSHYKMLYEMQSFDLIGD